MAGGLNKVYTLKYTITIKEAKVIPKIMSKIRAKLLFSLILVFCNNLKFPKVTEQGFS